MYNFYFRRSNGERRLLVADCTKEKANEAMVKFLDDHNFKSYYTRIWKENNETWYDVGAHTEFFILAEE